MTDRRGVFFWLHVTPHVARHPSGGGTSLLEGIFPLNWPIRARLFLLAPRPKSRRHHINKGWAWFEAMTAPSLHRRLSVPSLHGACSSVSLARSVVVERDRFRIIMSLERSVVECHDPYAGLAYVIIELYNSLLPLCAKGTVGSFFAINIANLIDHHWPRRH